jgi:peptide/nickel transport system permease protein
VDSIRAGQVCLALTLKTYYVNVAECEQGHCKDFLAISSKAPFHRLAVPDSSGRRFSTAFATAPRLPSHTVIRLLLSRLLGSLVLVALVGLLAFALGELGPDPAVTAAGPGAFPEDIAAARERLGVASSASGRLGDWTTNALRGDLGDSLLTGQPIIELVRQRATVTLTIAVAGILLASLLGVSAGLLAGTRAGTKPDQIVRVCIAVALATPPFWFASVLVLVFAVRLRWLPATQWTPFTVSPGGWLKGLILPAFAVSLFGFAAIARTTRGAAIKVVDQDFIRAARVRGLTRSALIRRHVLRNTAVAVLPVLGVQFIVTVGASALIENLMALPGLGRAVIDAASQGDTPVIQGVAIAVACLVAVTNVSMDLLQGALNPKTRR